MSKPSESGLPLLFRLLWPAPDGLPDTISAEQWVGIVRPAREHRLRPLLHSTLATSTMTPPAELAQDWQNAHRRSAERALGQRGEAIRLGRLLGDAGFQAYLLKGGAIAWRGWFDPALRPMRDLDLLVPHGDAVRVQKLLRNQGYTGKDGPNTENDKHLPGLRSPMSGETIEVHDHLIEPSGSDGRRHDAAFQNAALARAIELPGMGGLAALSDTDTLLHLILHGALDHQFNNGPLLAFDVLVLLDHGSIQWPAFWQTAKSVGGLRAAQLVLGFIESLGPDSQIEWHGHRPADLDSQTVAAVASLMLIERQRRTMLGLLGRIARHGWRDRFAELAKGIGRTAARSDAPPAMKAVADAPSASAAGQIVQSLQIARWLRR